jgi:hypothetical protein
LEGALVTGRGREGRRALPTLVRRDEVWIAALWLAFASGLAVVTSRIVDWYVMTDELLYERLAISIGRLHSPIPHVHHEVIGNVNQLYPLLLWPLFNDRLVPGALHDAHVLNAFVMTSAGIPAFLLARSVTRSRLLASSVAVLSVCVPWMTLSSFLMTEVVAYPAFVWTVLLLYRAVVRPGPRNDVLLLLALALATTARTQFAIFLLIVPLALYAYHAGLAETGSFGTRARAAARDMVAAHRPLAFVYLALALVGLGLLAAGRLSKVFGTYSVTAEGNLFPRGMPHSLLEHLAPLALGLGIVPLLAGFTWLLAALIRPRSGEHRAFASIAVVTVAALLVEVTSYDLRFGQGRLHDRYLFYVAPLILTAFAAMVRDGRWPRWALTVSLVLVALGFAYMPVVRYEKLNVDSPVAVLNDGLLDVGGSVNGVRLLLAFTVIALGVLLLVATIFVPRRRLGVVLLVLAALTIPSQTALAFNRLLTVDGTSGRPITLKQGVVFDWIDRELGPSASVTMVPYPILYGNYWENVGYWWNVEFWNESVDRAAVYEQAFTGTPETFPAVQLDFDRSTGRATISPSSYVVQGIAETRFKIAGRLIEENRGAALVAADRPWRAEWLTLGLYRDGWTVPRVSGKIRVFAEPGQKGALIRYLTVSLRAPQDISGRPFEIKTNAGVWQGATSDKGSSNQIPICVPAAGFADAAIEAPRYSPIYGDPRSEASFVSYARSGGVLVTGIALADETRPC